MEIFKENVITELGSIIECENNSENDNRNKNSLSSQNDVSLSSQQKLELPFWGLPKRVLSFYKNKGITRMFQWQLECLTLGRVLDAGNLVYSAPTSAGKTLVAEILIAKSVFELQKKVLVILPFVSVVREKMFYFQEMYASSGINVEGYMGGYSSSVSFKQAHVAVCTIEKANSIINKLLEEQCFHVLGLVVVDELHLLGDPYRGYLLELLLTKLKYVSSKAEEKIQIIGMSATLPNLKSLSHWLDADLYYTDFRPVPLKEKIKCGTTIYDKQFNKLSEIIPLSSEVQDDSENVGQLCLETIANGHSVLIFCPTKVWCENLADKISLFFKKNGCSKSAEVEGTPGWILRNQLNLKKINEVIEHLKMSPVGLDTDLQKTISYGVAFHHAGLTLDERDIIEGSFRKGYIRVLCATSTLSSGVNLPARRVIIRSPMSFGGLMDTLTYRQMIGRAGRMGVDSEGESILICKANEKSLGQTLMCSSLKPIESCLGHGHLSASLKRALLEIVASGIASNPEEVKEYASCTFLVSSSKHEMNDPIQSCIQFLEDNEFIRLQENGTVYVPTPLAKACLASSLPPDEGLALFRELQRARRCFVLDTDLHIIYQVTPYSVSEQWSKVDWLNVLNILEGLPPSMKRVGEMVGVEESFLVRVVKGVINPNNSEYRNKLSVHRRFYTSLALQDLINEVPLCEVAKKYECNKGMLQSLQQSAATYAGMVTEFTKHLGWNSVEIIFSQFQERLQFGIQRELCELMRLPLLNAMRARALFNAGFTSLSKVANANVSELENAFFKMVPFQSKKEIAGETSYDKEQRNKLETVWVTGKADLSIQQAAEMLIEESRNILELELGLRGVQWGKKENSIGDEALNKSSKNSVLKETHENEITIKNSEERVIQIDEFPSVLNNKEEKEVENIENLPDEIKELDMSKNICDIKGIDTSSNGRNEINSTMKSNFLNKTRLNNTDFELMKAFDAEKLIMDCNEEVNNVENFKLSNNSEAKNTTRNTDFNRTQKNKTEEIDYFASSFNFDIIPDFGTEKCDSKVNSKENAKVDLTCSDSDSTSSVEILYDSTILNNSKNLSLSRLSEDMFDLPKEQVNRKKMSTPISRQSNKYVKDIENEIDHRRLNETGSPDLFSQSLTFDTQLGKILDFDECPTEDKDIPLVVNASASLNSDDLGFVSDLSPPKPKQKQHQGVDNTNFADERKKQNECINNTEFKTPVSTKEVVGSRAKAAKRKVSAIGSPDVLICSKESSDHCQPATKRAKCSFLNDKNVVELSKIENGNESDDEILPTPKLDKTLLSNVSKKNKLCNGSMTSINHNIQSRPTNQKSITFPKSIKSTVLNGFSKKEKNDRLTAKTCNINSSYTNNKSDKINWDKINIIDICETEKDFQFFCDRLKEESIVGLALGCHRKIEEKKSLIGMKIKKKKTENLKLSSKCHYKDFILDGIAFYWEGNDVFYMSLDDGTVSLEAKINLLKTLCDKEKTIRFFDAKQQIKVLHFCCNVLLTSSYQDPKVACWLLSENWKEKNFSTITLEYLPCSKNLVSMIGSIVGYSSPGLFAKSITSHKTRASFEAFLTYHVISRQILLLREKGLLQEFEQVEMPLVTSLVEMELNGFRICRETLLNVSSKLSSAKESLEEKAFSIAQYKFSLSSSAAVNKVLYKDLGLEKDDILMTKKRNEPSTSKQALQALAQNTKHPLPEIILQWRKIRSVSSKFVFPLLRISTESTRIFGICQSFTATGRISMHEPNLQNIPKNFNLNRGKDDLVVSLRDIFIPTENCILMSVDYSQIELRMLAHLSNDSVLIENIKSSSDIFVSIAATVYGISNYDVNDTIRQRAKTTCYGIIYGIGPKNLSQQLEIEESDAVELIEEFKIKYQGVAKYLESVINDCRKKGYVTTLLGRRRYLPAISDSNQNLRMEAERQAINTTIQGSAADLVKTAMIMWRERLTDLNLLGVIVNLVLHLHDELIFEVDQNSIETVAINLKDVLENAMELSVPFPVKIKTGNSWGKLEEYALKGEFDFFLKKFED